MSRSKDWDAQINAASAAIKDHFGGSFNEMARAALTAAAEVGDKNAPVCPTCGASEPDWNAAAAFDAQTATIERCAQFAENYFVTEHERGHGEIIADAMREELLKDKP